MRLDRSSGVALQGFEPAGRTRFSHRASDPCRTWGPPSGGPTANAIVYIGPAEAGPTYDVCRDSTNGQDSQITQPRTAAVLFHLREPAARRVQCDHHPNPDRVYDRQRIAPPGRRSERIVRDIGRLEHPVRVAV